MLASNIQHRLYIGLEKHGVSSLACRTVHGTPRLQEVALCSGHTGQAHFAPSFQAPSTSQVPSLESVLLTGQTAYRIASESSTSFHFHSIVYEFYLKGPDVNFVMYFFLPFLKESAVYQDSALMAQCP